MRASGVVVYNSPFANAPKDWNEQGSKGTILDVYKDFGESVLAILSKIDPTTLKVWTLLDMEPLSSWTKGKLGLMGDAAHPFLPRKSIEGKIFVPTADILADQGQGGGVAIEDAASLAVLLHRGVGPEEIPERLKLYENCRMERANKIQQYTRLSGRDLDEVKSSGKELDGKHPKSMSEKKSYVYLTIVQ